MLSVVFGPLDAVKAEETEAYTESQTETSSEAATEPAVEVVTKTATEPAANSEPETVAETETETDTEAKPVTETEGTTETEPATESGSSTEAAAETEPVTEPESPAETETVTEGETSGESETETEPVTETETEAQKTPQAQVQSVSPAQNQILTVSEIDEAVQNVQDQIDALPTVSEVQGMEQSARDAAYIQAQDVWDAYDALNAEQQVQVDAAKLTELLDFFNGQAVVTAGTNQPSTNSVAEVVMNGSTTYYDTLNEAVQTVSNAGGTATITLLKNASLTGYNSSPIYGNITLIGGTHTISGDNLGIIIAGTLTVMSGTFERALLYSAGTINIYGGIYYAVSSSANNAQGTVNIYGGTFNIVDALSGGTINIYGGSISDIRGNVNYPVTNISLSPSSLTLAPETTQSLTATISPEIAASHATVSWSSSNENVAKISGSGTTVTVTAGAPGTTTITVRAGGKTATCTVTVSNPAPTIRLTVRNSESAVTNIAYGSTVTLEASVTDNNGTSVTGGTVDFYRRTVEEGNKLNDTPVSVNAGTASARIQIAGDGWKPSETAYTITAVYTPVSSAALSVGSATANLTVGKGTPSATPPSPIQGLFSSENSITLIPVTGEDTDTYGSIQYGYTTGNEESVPDGRWQDSTVFTGLQPGTDYTFYTRYAGNDFYYASSASPGQVHTTWPDITTDITLPNGYVGVPYHVQLQATVASGKEITWSLGPGATLPAGLQLNSDGTITGMPTATAIGKDVEIMATIRYC